MTEAEIEELLKNSNDLLANENLQAEEEKPDEKQNLVNQIDASIDPPKQEQQIKQELPKATPSPLPAPALVKELELDLTKPSNQVLSIIGDRDQEDFDAADLELIDGLDNGQDLYELSKARPDISLKTDQLRKIFEYQRTSSPYTKTPENAADWYNLTDAALEDVGDVLSMTGEMVWGGLKGAGKMIQYGTPALLGMNSTYAEALALEKMLDPEKRQEVESWRKRAWQIANTPLKGGEQPNPDSYTDEKYLQKVKENLSPKKAPEIEKTAQEFEQKRYKAKQVPYSYLDELAGLPISLNFLGTKIGSGGMQAWDNISEKFGIQDKEKSFDNWLARNEVDTAQAKMIKAEPRAFARVVQTYYAPAMKSFTNLIHPSVEEYMIMYPELSREEAQAKRAEQIESDVQTTIEDIKKDIPETDPDIGVWGSLSTPSGFGMDNFGFAYNVLSAGKQLTPLVRTKLRQMRYTDDQINAFEKQAQQALKAKELKRLEKLGKAGPIERAAGATARGIEKVGDYIERSPTMQKIGKALPVASGAMLGYQIDPENPLQSLAVGSLGGAVGIPVAKQTLKTITEIPKSIKEISAARRISAGGVQGPLATLKTIAQQQDEVKTLSAKLKTYAEGTDEYIETEKLLKDAKDKLKGIKAGGTDVVDYQGIGKVSDTTKRILRFVNDDMVSNIGEYAKLGIEPTLVGLATGIIDSSDEDELKNMIGQGLAFSLGGRAVQQSFNKFIGEDPVIAARKSRQANVDALKAYRDSSPETRGEIDQLTDWDNVINRQAAKAEQAQIALQDLQAKGADPAKIAEAQKRATAEQKSLSLLKTANVQTRNEFGRQFLQQLGRNNMLLNGSLKAGQNNVGFHILSTQQIFDHFRKNPAFANVPDDVILTYAGQSGFYSGGGQQGESNMAFDPAKPAIVLNSDALRNRMEVFGETPIDALNHETGHHISRVPEIQDALGDVKKILFTNEIKDASGLTKTITNGLYTNDQLVDLFDSQYLKNRSKQEKEQIAKSLGLWDSGLNQLDKESVKNYMQEEILAEVFSNTLSRNLGKNIDDKQIHLLDFARLKLKNNLLKKAAVKMLGLGMDGNVESAVTGAQITPEAQSAARNALRIMQSMNGDFSTINSQPDVPAISKADIKKSKIAAERYGMDSGLFDTKTIAQVFDAAGKPVGDAVEVTDPAVFEGSWRIGKDGEERLSGYGQIPIELRQLQVPEGGTLSISKQLQTEADGVTPKMLEKGELAKRIKNRAELFKKAIDTPDYGTPGRFEPVYEGSETYRGSFTPMQIQAIKELPEGIVPLKIKKYLLELNDAIVRKDGTRFFVDYAAVMDDKGNYKAFSPKIYDVVPIGLQLSSAGNFLVTTISVGRMREKLNLWADRMPGRLSPWNGSKEAFWQDFSKKYLANWAAEIEGSGYKNGVPVGNNQLDPDYQKAEEKKSILNDYLNLFTNETRPLNLDRTQIPQKQGDPKNKSADRTIMSMRVDHFAELLSGEHLPKLPVDYGKAIRNFMPAPQKSKVPTQEELDLMKARLPKYTTEIQDINETQKYILVYDENGNPAASAEVSFNQENNSLDIDWIQSQIKNKGFGAAIYREVAKYAQQQNFDFIEGDIVDDKAIKRREELLPIISKTKKPLGDDEYATTLISKVPSDIRFMPSAETEAPSGERGFKSKLQTEIQKKFTGANATPEQLKAVVGNPQFVKPEEVKWSGVMDEIDRLAQENNGKVPVQQLVNYLRDEGQVKFEEVTLGGKEPFDANRLAELEAEYKKLKQHPIDDPSFGEDKYEELIRLMNIRDQSTTETLYYEAERVMNLAQQAQRRGDKKTAEKYFQENEFLNTRAEKLDLQGQGLKNPPKFAGYQLPGGENYREVVLTAAQRKGQPRVVPHPDKNLGGFALQYSDGSYAGGDRPYQWKTKLAATEGVQKYKDEYGDIGFTSSHFPDVPNYIAHMRVNERTDAEGNAGLFVEEFQSDRHQQGREKGYKEDYKPLSKEEKERKSVLLERMSILEENGINEENPNAEFQELNSEFLNLAFRDQGGRISSVPDAPFRKDWGVQLFKRALRDAVESGKSWIGWTTGIEQIKRYEETLRQQVKSIEWTTEDGLTIVDVQPTKGKRIYLPVKNGKIYRTADQQSLVGKDLAEVIGKEATAKANESSSGKLIGDDLTIGGEGMKGFYDQILPKEIGKYVAKMGGKVEKADFPRPTEVKQSDLDLLRELGVDAPSTVKNEITTQIWRVNITPEMENVVRAGQIQFMPAKQEGAMPAEPQGMEGVEAPQTYRRISDMIPPLQGVELPEAIAKATGELGLLRKALENVEAPGATVIPDIPQETVEAVVEKTKEIPPEQSAFISEKALRKFDSLGDKNATQVNADNMKYPVNSNPDSVALPGRWGVVNAKITGMPKTFKEVGEIIDRQVNRLVRLVNANPEFAKESARFYRDMAESATMITDAAFPQAKGKEKYLFDELVLRFLALGSPRTSVAANASKSAGSVAALIDQFEAGYKIGFGEQSHGAKTTYNAWKEGGHFDLSLPGVQDKVRSFYLNSLAELIEMAEAQNDVASVDELMIRAGKSMRILDPNHSAKLTDAEKKEIQRLLDGKATIDMWDMAAKGWAWPGYIIFKNRRNSVKQPFQWSQDDFEKVGTFKDKNWKQVLSELKITSPDQLRYQQARALKIDGNPDWTLETWNERKSQSFPDSTKFSYYTEGTEAGLSPGGGGPLYDAQQAIDGLLADRLNELGLATLFGKTKLKARNAQEILWALEKLDNPIEANNDLALFGNTFEPFLNEVLKLRTGKDVDPKSRAENVLAAMERAYATMAQQLIPIEVVSGGTSEEAKRIQDAIKNLQSAGDPDAATTLTLHIADGLGNAINDLAIKHGIKATIENVDVGEGGYTENQQVSVAPNIRVTLRGKPEETFLVLETLSRAMDQDGGNVIRKPTMRELNDSRVNKNLILTIPTTGLDQAQRNKMFLDLAALKDANGDLFLTGFTEVDGGIAIGNQFYSGDYEKAVSDNKTNLDSVLKSYNQNPNLMNLDIAIIQTFFRGQASTKIQPEKIMVKKKEVIRPSFASDLYDYIKDRMTNIPLAGSRPAFGQKTDFEKNWIDKADTLFSKLKSYPVETKPQIEKAKLEAPDIASNTKRTAALVALKSELETALLRDQISEDVANRLKAQYGFKEEKQPKEEE